MTKKLLLFVAALTAVGRIFITPRLTNIPTATGTYEAFAHMLVGFLLLVYFYDRDQRLGPSKLYAWLGLGLGLWEAGWFLVQKLH
jgi:hypothetical protein